MEKKPRLIFHCDCNNFFASCERVFRPDLEGKPVKSEEIFSGHAITMINMWATWCDPCKEELPALAEMAESYEKKGCRIIGLCLDAEDEETMAKAETRVLWPPHAKS